MSMHKRPLTQIEGEGLRAHGLDIGTPSQLSDAFRQGVAWGQTAEREACAVECEKQNPHPDQWSDDAEFTEKRVALACALAIRNRTNVPPTMSAQINSRHSAKPASKEDRTIYQSIADHYNASDDGARLTAKGVSRIGNTLAELRAENAELRVDNAQLRAELEEEKTARSTAST